MTTTESMHSHQPSPGLTGTGAGLTWKIIAIITLIGLLIGGISALIRHQLEWQAQKNQLSERINAISSRLAISLAQALEAGDQAAIQAAAQAEFGDPMVASIAITTKATDQTLAHYHRDSTGLIVAQPDPSPTLQGTAHRSDIRRAGSNTVIGGVAVEGDLDRAYNDLQQLTMKDLGIQALILGLAICTFVLVINKLLVRPLVAMRQSMQEVERLTSASSSWQAHTLQPNVTLNRAAFAEIRQMGAIFADMLQAIREKGIEQQAMQERMLQAQKLESIGQLAGGIAHDFNNMLAGIVGCAELLRRPDCPQETRQRLTQQIIATVERGASLTSQLLMFSRKNSLDHRVIDLVRVVNDTVAILQHSIDPSISLEVQSPDRPVRILGNAAQIENVLINLGVNARDAMPQGGHLRFVLDIEDPTRTDERAHTALLSISDNGIGMDADTLAKACEPFFTTKDVGKGTGLGLASVYGVIEGHKGSMHIDSTPELGTTVTLRLPLTTRDPSTTGNIDVPITSGKGCILVVDDEELVRDNAVMMLKELGYRTFEAATGDKAISMVEDHPTRYDLVLLDMQMPGKNGCQTLLAIHAISPKLPIILVSGYLDESKLADLPPGSLAGRLSKPYRMAELSGLIADALTD